MKKMRCIFVSVFLSERGKLLQTAKIYLLSVLESAVLHGSQIEIIIWKTREIFESPSAMDYNQIGKRNQLYDTGHCRNKSPNSFNYWKAFEKKMDRWITAILVCLMMYRKEFNRPSLIIYENMTRTNYF